MEFRQIEYFQVVSQLKNYTKAAEQLHVSQLSISVSIQKLEEELGIKLPERDNKKVITREGAIFLRESGLVLKRAEHLKHVMAALRQDQSTYEILSGIKSDELEIGFGVLDLNQDQEIETHPLMSDELKLLVSSGNALALCRTVDIEELSGKRLLCTEKARLFPRAYSCMNWKSIMCRWKCSTSGNSQRFLIWLHRIWESRLSWMTETI